MSVAARGFFYVQQVEQHARRILDECLQTDDLTAGQYMALSLVVRHEPVSSSDLARRAHITAQSMGEFIKALEAKGMLDKRTDASNRRVILLTSTPAGRKAMVRSDAKVDQAERLFFDCLSGEEFAHLRLLLSRLRSIRGSHLS
jgi:DNA-binding MarR family transcriptional regulator